MNIETVNDRKIFYTIEELLEKGIDDNQIVFLQERDSHYKGFIFTAFNEIGERKYIYMDNLTNEITITTEEQLIGMFDFTGVNFTFIENEDIDIKVNI